MPRVRNGDATIHVVTHVREVVEVAVKHRVRQMAVVILVLAIVADIAIMYAVIHVTMIVLEPVRSNVFYFMEWCRNKNPSPFQIYTLTNKT